MLRNSEKLINESYGLRPCNIKCYSLWYEHTDYFMEPTRQELFLEGRPLILFSLSTQRKFKPSFGGTKRLILGLNQALTLSNHKNLLDLGVKIVAIMSCPKITCVSWVKFFLALLYNSIRHETYFWQPLGFSFHRPRPSCLFRTSFCLGGPLPLNQFRSLFMQSGWLSPGRLLMVFLSHWC